MLRKILPALAALALAASSAEASAPVMPIGEVARGMHCQALSVVKGTAISAFDAEVLDVITDRASRESTYIMIRVSGPAVETTGIGPGFSGSPLMCPRADGQLANAGAISLGIGEWENKTALATPIAAILGEPVDPPRGATAQPAIVRAARRLEAPLSISGLSPQTATLVQRASQRLKRPYVVVPGAPLPNFPAAPLQPGSAVSVGYSSGDLALGAVGTVTYTDGDRVWAFGHPFDNVGARSLFLQDAYVYGIVNNPIGMPGLSTYKLAAPVHDVGTLTNDASWAVAGRLGKLPDSIPVELLVTDDNTRKTDTTRVNVADEGGVGTPLGMSPLSLVAPLAVFDSTRASLQGVPAKMAGTMCLRLELDGRAVPIRFCNSYLAPSFSIGGDFGDGGIPYMMARDVESAVGLLDGYRFGRLSIKKLAVNVHLNRVARQAFVTDVRVPRRVRRGQTIRARLSLRWVGGKRTTRVVRVRVPRELKPGRRQLTITGSPADGESSSPSDLLELILGPAADKERKEDERGPTSVDELAASVEELHRFTGVLATWGSRRSGPAPVVVLEDPPSRISGSAEASVRVAR